MFRHPQEEPRWNADRRGDPPRVGAAPRRGGGGLDGCWRSASLSFVIRRFVGWAKRSAAHVVKRSFDTRAAWARRSRALAHPTKALTHTQRRASPLRRSTIKAMKSRWLIGS